MVTCVTSACISVSFQAVAGATTLRSARGPVEPAERWPRAKDGRWGGRGRSRARLLSSVYPERVASWSSGSARGRGFGDLEAYEHLAGRDVWCCHFQVWQVLGQPRGRSAIRLLHSRLIVEDADRGRSLGDFEEVVGLESVDAADDLPDVFCVLGERVGEVAVSGVCADDCVHGSLPHLVSWAPAASQSLVMERSPPTSLAACGECDALQATDVAGSGCSCSLFFRA